MADFYEDFKNNINNRPEPDFNSADWADLDARLDARPRRAVPLLWWTTGALLLLLLGSNIWWLSQNKNTAQQTISSTNTVIIRDTVYQKEVIYRIDTLIQIQRIVETKTIAAASSNPPFYSQSFAANGIFQNNSNNKLSTQKLVSFQKKYSANGLLERAVFGLQTSNSSLGTSQVSFSLPGVAALTEKKKEGLGFLITDLTALETEKISLSDDIKGLPLVEKEKYRRKVLLNMWRKIQPTGFNLEAVGNLSLLLNSERESQGTEGVGLTASFEFSPTFRLWVSSITEQLRYKSNAQGDEYGIPIVPPPSDEFTFKYAELSQSDLHLATGFQYYFRADKKWNPYIGIGIGGRFLNGGTIKYEYENGNTEIEENLTIAKRAYQLEYLDFQTGIAYQWNNRWQSRFGLEYLQYTKSEAISSALRFQLGVGYSF